jgi:hypothetical protein
MRTGDTVIELGLYTTECCSEEQVFDLGDLFGRCPSCHETCWWEFEEEAIPCDNLEANDGVAA